jgi:pyridoxal phosphate enzyme (YggS family)
MNPSGGDERTAQLRGTLATVTDQIAAAARAAERDPGSVHLIVVTKTYPTADVRRLAALGVGDVGENRAGELTAKAAECTDVPLRWHFIGQLQRNKAVGVARVAAMVHSVDRASLVDSLDAAVGRLGRDRLPVLLQVSLDGVAGRGGCPIAEVPALADRIAGTTGLQLRGVMAVAPLAAEPDPAFARLAEVAAGVAAAHPGADLISAGMSTDLESAIRHGATHVRVGGAILGERVPV